MQTQLFRSGMMMEEGYDMMGSMDEEMPPPRKAQSTNGTMHFIIFHHFSILLKSQNCDVT